MVDHAQWSVKHRPRKLADIVGNETTKSMASQYLESRNSHALLLTGPSGCGKTTLANIIAKKFSGGSSANILEKNFAAEGGKDDARAMIEAARYLPMTSDRDVCKVFICEEAHGLTKQATAALLRPVEEPPHNQQIWIFVTDRPWMLDVAILTRCRKFPLEAPEEKDVARYVYSVIKDEKALRHLEQEDRKKAAFLIARYAGCVPREAIQLLQNVHDAKLKDLRGLKEYVIQAKSGGDAAMDRVASIILAAIFDRESKVDARISKLVRSYATVDTIGLLNRLLFCLHAVMLFALAGKHNYAVKGVIEAFGKNKPKIEDMSWVLLTLGRIRQQLREIVIDPSTVVLPTLMECVFKLSDEK